MRQCIPKPPERRLEAVLSGNPHKAMGIDVQGFNAAADRFVSVQDDNDIIALVGKPSIGFCLFDQLRAQRLLQFGFGKNRNKTTDHNAAGVRQCVCFGLCRRGLVLADQNNPMRAAQFIPAFVDNPAFTDVFDKPAFAKVLLAVVIQFNKPLAMGRDYGFKVGIKINGFVLRYCGTSLVPSDHG